MNLRYGYDACLTPLPGAAGAKMKTQGVNLPVTMLRDLRRLREATGRSISDIVRTAIERLLQDLEEQKG